MEATLMTERKEPSILWGIWILELYLEGRGGLNLGAQWTLDKTQSEKMME